MSVETTKFSPEENEILPQQDFVELLRERPITLIEEQSFYTIGELKRMFPDQKIFACDFRVKSIEGGKAIAGGYKRDVIINIDHHAPTDRMERRITSTNLAIDYVRQNGPVEAGVLTLINHTDCDSILASAILKGILPPEERFGRAAIAADHTGEPEPIAELLLAFNDKRDVEFSLRNLQAFLGNQPLEPEAQELLKYQKQQRERAKQLVANGAFRQTGRVFFSQLTQKIETSLLMNELPEAEVIMIISPHQKNPKNWEVKLRLGQAAPEGLNLQKIGIRKIDRSYGGRWNAGSNKRGGGTEIEPKEYVQLLNEKIEQFEKGD